jgi:predicted CXXCH cytochrome family protein
LASASVIAALVLLCSSAAWRVAAQSAAAPPGAQAGASSEPTPHTTGGYVGSTACERCHRTAYAQWKASVHVRMTQEASDASILGDFAVGAAIRANDTAVTPHMGGGGPAISITRDGVPPEDFSVHYTLGEKRFQGYMSRLRDGRIFVLPAFWHVEWQRWIDWTEITPVPKAAHDYRQIWNVNCFNCHATNIARNFDLTSKTFATTWTELGVGCEACHGPGGVHVERMLTWGRNPAAFPDIDPDRPTPDMSERLAIFTPRASSARQVFDACSYCHGNKTNHFVGFTPGRRLEDFAQLALASDPVPSHDPQGEFWADGRPSRFNRPQAVMQSRCFITGGATCTNCHAAHGSANDHSLKVPLSDTNRLCTQCHSALADTPSPAEVARAVSAAEAALPDLVAHTHHAPRSPGSSCVACHMSEVNWRLLMRRRDHTFAAPVPEVTARYGTPNACTSCHEDRTPEWAMATMDEWYGDGVRRARTLAVADAFDAAGQGRQAAMPTLTRLATDQTQSAFIRASAAGFLGRLVVRAAEGSGGASGGADARATSPELAPSARRGAVNALVAAASDPEAMVRVAAVRALAAVDDPIATSAIAARITDAARVVRASAAEALLMTGITALPAAAGVALARAQDDYADSLRTFGDMASHHTSLGWLAAARGDGAAADRELRQAIALDTSDARPHIYLGVLAARRQQFAEAISHWKAARRLDPGHPQVDRLIAEASARVAARH